MLENSAWTDTAAFVGAISGLLSFFWLVYEHATNKGKLEIHACVVESMKEIKEGENCKHVRDKGEIRCSLTNTGRQTVYPIEVNFKYKNMTYGVYATAKGFPPRLE